MKLLSVIKNSCLLAGVVLITNMYAMEQAIVLQKQKSNDHCVSRKASKFDFLKLQQLGPWYEKLSEKQKAQIQSNLKEQDKGSQVLFHFVITLPQDIQKLVVAHMFEGYSYATIAKENPKNHLGEYVNAVNKFYRKEIRTVFDAHFKAANLLEFLKKKQKEDKETREWRKRQSEYQAYGASIYCYLYSLINDPAFKQHIIFELLEDIFVFRACANNKIGQWPSCNKNELQSINRVFNKFSELKKSGEVKYEFHDSCTVENFKKYCNREQWLALPIFLIPLILDMFPSHWDEKINHEIVERNKVRDFINIFLKNEYEKTGNDILLGEMRKNVNPIYFSRNNWGYLKGHLYGVSTTYSFVISLFVCEVGSAMMKWALLGTLGYSAFAIHRLFFATGTLLEQPLVGITCVTGLYAFIVALYNIKQMRTLRVETISLKNLSELLERTDIVIE